MDCYTPKQVPIISTLAENFTTLTNWFSSFPGCTIPNKMFFHCASAGGNTSNPKFVRDGDDVTRKAVETFGYPLTLPTI